MAAAFAAGQANSSRLPGELAAHIRDHLALSASALALALAIAFPLGILSVRSPLAGSSALTLVNVLRTIPSLAILGLAIPFLGVGFVPSIVALSILAVPPIAIAVGAGLRSVPAATREAALGLGMEERDVRRRIDWPIALPVVFSGVHTATVEVIASATLAAFIGGGGLGELIVNGLANNDTAMLLTGAAAVAVLTLAAEALLGTLERRLHT